MKRIIATVSLLSLFFATVSAQVPSSCAAPLHLRQAYARDIVNMCMTAMIQDQSPDTALVHVPAVWRDAVTGGLAAIFNATTAIPQADSVFNLYCVHDDAGWVQTYHDYLVEVDTNYAWTQAWQNLNTMTGDPSMDAMLTLYDLHVTQFYNWSIGNYALIYSDSFWNARALVDSLMTVPGVVFAEPNAIWGAAGKVRYSAVATDRYYDFAFEFNDCFDGCDNSREWHFKVAADCSVEYMGFDDWGVFGIEPLPAPLNCNLSTDLPPPVAQDLQFTAMPNPFARQTVVSVTLPGTDAITLKLYDATGALVRDLHAGQVDGHKRQEIEVDGSGLSRGIYFCTLQTGAGMMRTLKLIFQ